MTTTSQNDLWGSVVRRFHERVDVRGADECWPWVGKKIKNGYGFIPSGATSGFYAHRVALMVAGRTPPPGAHALHRCDNPPCCNPAHLWWGDNAENAADARHKGLRLKPTCRRGHQRTDLNTYVRVDRRGYMERHCMDCKQGGRS